jgi:hypothetical protein
MKAALARWLREIDAVALYIYHRQHCGMGRRRALWRTVVCWL